LASLIRALDLFAPLFVLLNLIEENELLAVVACYANDLEELFEDVRALPCSQNPWALKRTVFLPSGDALFTEELPAVLAFHRLLQNLYNDY